MSDTQSGKTGTHLSQDIARLMGRRRALGLMAGAAGLPLLNGCTSEPPAPASGRAPVSASAACVRWPEETNGPYPADGTNNAQGSLANVLIESGIVRADMRQSFGDLSGEAPGVPMTLAIKLVDTTDGCIPLAGYAVYAWHCTADGLYSLYNIGDQNFLRAVGVTSASGEVRFVTNFPGCYPGRVPHIHFEVYPSLEAASAFANRILCSQLAFPDALAEAIYTNNAIYADSLTPFRNISISRDNVFADNTAAEIAAQTAQMSGSVRDGLTAALVVGIDPTAEPVSVGPGGPDGFPGGRPPRGFPPPGGFPPGGPPPGGPPPGEFPGPMPFNWQHQ